MRPPIKTLWDCINKFIFGQDEHDQHDNDLFGTKRNQKMTTVVPVESIVSKIVLLRGEKVLLDQDLAELYDVETKQLKRAVRRHINRFPEDFMFQLTKEEYRSLRSQFGTLKRGAHSKYPPMAFTEQGIAMLSGILHSERAVQVNIQIMRVFVKFRRLLVDNEELRQELSGLKQITEERFSIVFETLDQLLTVESKPKKIYPVQSIFVMNA